MFQIIASTLITLTILLGWFNTATMSSLKYLTTDYWFADSKLGSFTQLASSDAMSAFPTTYNANLAKTIEVGTTSIASITTLSSLSSIGTITTGVWNGTAIPVSKGGTGTTSPSTYMVMLGNGANGLTMASTTGTSGQFLTSNGAGAYPSWGTPSVNESIAYNWTGLHTFAATTTFATTTATKVLIGTTVPQYSLSNPDLYVNGDTYLKGGLGIGISETTDGNLKVNGTASTTNLVVSGTCTNCATNGYEVITNSASGPGSDDELVAVTATCSAGKKVVGGGGSVSDRTGPDWHVTVGSEPSGTNAWVYSGLCLSTTGGTCTAGTEYAYAICVNQ